MADYSDGLMQFQKCHYGSVYVKMQDWSHKPTLIDVFPGWLKSICHTHYCYLGAYPSTPSLTVLGHCYVSWLWFRAIAWNLQQECVSRLVLMQVHPSPAHQNIASGKKNSYKVLFKALANILLVVEKLIFFHAATEAELCMYSVFFSDI